MIIYSLQETKKKLQTRDFTYRRNCQVCGEEKNEFFIMTKDRCMLVKCSTCGFVFTNPVLDKRLWESYLQDRKNEDATTIANNRYAFGVAHKKMFARQIARYGVRVYEKKTFQF